MSTVPVTIDSQGTPTPDPIQAGLGDIVAFHADGADVVVCIDPASYFGGERFEIANGDTLDLPVQSVAGGGFEYIVKVGDLSAPCTGGRGTKDGSGQGGP